MVLSTTHRLTALAFAEMQRGDRSQELYRSPATVPTPTARKYLGGSRLYQPNGARECARRARQIAAGSLRAENGLRSPGALLP